MFTELFRTDINELYWTLGKVLEDSEFIYEIGSRHDLFLGDFENLAFIGAARILGSLRLDLDALEKLHDLSFIDYLGEVRMEDITANPKALSALIMKISSQQVEIKDSYLESIFQIGHINKHRKDNIKITPEERYNSLADWQKEVINFYLKKYSIVDEYKKFSYNFDYLVLE